MTQERGYFFSSSVLPLLFCPSFILNQQHAGTLRPHPCRSIDRSSSLACLNAPPPSPRRSIDPSTDKDALPLHCLPPHPILMKDTD
jgi:hypothetical protein